jgi:hypothetical protein
LTNEETNADSGEVEAVKPALDVETDATRFLTALPFEDTLGDSGNGWVVATFDLVKGLGEALVVVVKLGRPFQAFHLGVVSFKVRQKERRKCGKTKAPLLNGNTKLQAIGTVSVSVETLVVVDVFQRWVGDRIR